MIMQFVMTQQMITNSEKQGKNILKHITLTTIIKLINSTIIIINLWWAQTNEFLTVGMGFATIFSFVCGYLLIISLNIGLTFQISRKRKDATMIGIFYQRALITNLLFCAFFITPLLYISESVVNLFSSIIPEFKQEKERIGQYLYQLVPSIWAFAFYDTTRSFLQAQGRILAPLVIQFTGMLIHIGLITNVGPAWSKNFSDMFRSIAIYTYIMLFEGNLQSWTQWTIKCIKGWKRHIRFLEIIGLATYAHALFFFFFSLLACKLRREQLICHIYYINIYQFIYLSFIGIQEGCLSKIGFYIKQNRFKIYFRVGMTSIKLTIGMCLLLVSCLLIFKEKVHRMFMYVYVNESLEGVILQSEAESSIFYDNYHLLALTLLVNSVFISVSSLLKALDRDNAIITINVAFYLLTGLLGYYMCYSKKMGLKGLWLGWLIGSLAGSGVLVYKLLWKEMRKVGLARLEPKVTVKSSQ